MPSGTDLDRRLRRASWFAAAVVLGLAARAGQLQIARGAELAGKLDDARVKRVRLPPPRGTLRDARGVVIAEDGVAYDAYLVPYRSTGVLERFSELTEALALGEAEQDRVRAHLAAAPGRQFPVLLKRDIGPETAAALRSRPLWGLTEVRERAARRHPRGALAVHAIGYLNEILLHEVDADHRPGDRIGRAGVERAFEKVLRGTAGMTLRAASSRVTVPPSRQREGVAPIPGKDVTLTLDLELVRVLEDAFEQQHQRLGAAVMLDVRTGRVLAMVSRPSFDPGLVDRGLPLPTEDRPEVDRAMMDAVAPGATLEPFTALAALAADRAAGAPHPTVCTGGVALGGRTFRCHQVHGVVDVDRALAQDCNMWFAERAQRHGLDAMTSVATRFGLGEPTGIGIGLEDQGLLPNQVWYQLDAPRPQPSYAAVGAAVGLGDVTATPLQLAVAYAALANGGTVFEPRLVLRAGEETLAPVVRRQVAVPEADLAQVRAGLLAAVADARHGGTFSGLQGRLAGMVGSGIFVPDRPPPAFDDGPLTRNGWFAGYAPANAPEVAVVVSTRDTTGDASGAAARIAAGALRAYLAGRDGGSR
jgi:penicillin-binding protein 2